MDLKTDQRSLKPGCVQECPACPHRLLTKAESLAQKQKFLEWKLAQWTDVTEPVRSVDEHQRWGYRDKVRLHTHWNGVKWEAGIIHKQQLIPIPNCPVESENVRFSLNLFLKSLPPSDLFPMVFYVQSGKQVALVLKQARQHFSGENYPLLNQIAELAGVDGLWLHFNPSAGHKVFLKGGWEHISGNPYSIDRNGLMYGPVSFQQAIPELFGNALEECASFLKPENSLMVDLFTGTGSSIRKWSQFENCISIGIESGMESVKLARINNPGTDILLGNCEDRIPQIEKFIEKYPIDQSQIKLFVNPPRTGIGEKLINWIIASLKPAKIAYLSCSAGTLSRDLTMFSSNGYVIRKIIPYDFLPQTIHIEILALLSG